MLDYEPRRALQPRLRRASLAAIQWARGVIAAALVLSFVLMSRDAHAQDEMSEPPAKTLQEHDEAARLGPAKTDKKARELFEKGRTAWDEGRFREAWEYWHHSYRLSRKPELLYNVGQAADRLRMDREALEAFRLYLEKNPNAPNRKEVENRIQILEREVDKKSAQSEEPTSYLSEGLNDEDVAATSEDAGSEGGIASASQDDDDLAGPAASSDGQPERKGLYLRADAGFGLWGDAVSDTAGNGSSLSSLTFTLDAKVGYGVTPEIVVGGGLLLDYALNPEITSDGGPAGEIRGMSLTLLQIFADYYLAPREDGWRLFGGLGLGRLALSGGGLGNEDAGGGALLIGGGYELPFDTEIGFGIDLRLLIGRFSNDTTDHTLFAPAVTGAAVWY